MTIQLQPLQITAMWDTIKFVAIEANDVNVTTAAAFISSLLGNLLSGKAQVWVTMTESDAEGNREMIAMTITYLQEEMLWNFNYLVLHSVYGFKPMTLEIINGAVETYTKYAKTCGCQKVVVMTVNERVAKLFTKVGFDSELYVHSKDI